MDDNPGFQCLFAYTDRGAILQFESIWYGHFIVTFFDDRLGLGPFPTLHPNFQGQSVSRLMKNWTNYVALTFPGEAGKARYVQQASDRRKDVIAQIRAWIETSSNIDCIGISTTREVTLLACVAFHDHVPSVRTLLSHGANVNCPGKTGQTPLMLAGRRVFDLLVRSNADVNAADLDGRTVLMHSTAKGIKVVKALIQRGAHINVRNRYQETALHSGVYHHDVLQYLLKHGAEINVQNLYGRSPLMIAAQGGDHEAVRILISHGADRDLRDSKGKSASMLCEEIIERINDPEDADIDRSALLAIKMAKTLRELR